MKIGSRPLDKASLRGIVDIHREIAQVEIQCERSGDGEM